MYKEELITASVSTDDTKPEPRERAHRQTQQRKESENSSSKSASTRRWWSIPVTSKFLTASLITLPFPISFCLGSAPRTSRRQWYSGWLCAVLPGWMDGLMAWLRGFYITIHTWIGFYFYFFYSLLYPFALVWLVDPPAAIHSLAYNIV